MQTSCRQVELRKPDGLWNKQFLSLFSGDIVTCVALLRSFSKWQGEEKFWVLGHSLQDGLLVCFQKGVSGSLATHSAKSETKGAEDQVYWKTSSPRDILDNWNPQLTSIFAPLAPVSERFSQNPFPESCFWPLPYLVVISGLSWYWPTQTFCRCWSENRCVQLMQLYPVLCPWRRVLSLHAQSCIASRIS